MELQGLEHDGYSELRMRKSREADIERIMEILTDGRGALASLGIDQWQGGYPHRDVVERDITEGASYVVEDAQGQLVATAMLGFTGEKDYNRIEDGAWLTQSLSDDPRYVVLHRVAVAGERRGSGAGKLIVREAQRIVRENSRDSLRVDTHPGNLPMRRLLEKEGFTRCGTIYISHAEEATPERVAFEKLLQP